MTPTKFYKTLNICGILKPEFRFLELGTSNGNAYNSLEFEEKYTVDIIRPESTMGNHRSFEMSTDTFFESIDVGKFDLIFIDADHDAPQVLKDYNSAVKILNKGGIIVLHDCYPPNEEYCESRFCSDSYKILSGLIDLGLNVFYTKEDFGLTVVFNQEEIKVKDINFNLSYQDFIDKNNENGGNYRNYPDVLYSIIKKIRKNEG